MRTANSLSLTARNLRLYFRDRWAIFFSLMGALVLLVLYMLFLGTMTAEGLEAGLPGASHQTIRAFIDAWMFSGIVLISTVTTGLAALTALVDDRASGRFKDFLVAPVSRSALTVSYLVAAVVVAMIITGLLVLLGFLYLGVRDATWLPWANLARIFGITVLCCFSFGALSAYAATFMVSSGAFSAFNATVGTLIGFVAAAYIPIGVLPQGVAGVINVLPFSQAGMLLRQQFTGPILQELTADAPQAKAAIEAEFGITLEIGTWSIPSWFVLVYLATAGIVFTVLAARRIRTNLE